MTPRKTRSAKDRLLDRVAAGYGGCWIFTGHVGRTGYGWLKDDRQKTQTVHRIAYEAFVGPVPAGLHLDHLCRVRRCVNPYHLEAVAQRVNSLRGESFSAINARKTHCAQGHEFSPENTYYKPNGDKPPTRQCRRCMAEWQAAYYRRKTGRTTS